MTQSIYGGGLREAVSRLFCCPGYIRVDGGGTLLSEVEVVCFLRRVFGRASEALRREYDFLTFICYGGVRCGCRGCVAECLGYGCSRRYLCLCRDGDAIIVLYRLCGIALFHYLCVGLYFVCRAGRPGLQSARRTRMRGVADMFFS